MNPDARRGKGVYSSQKKKILSLGVLEHVPPMEPSALLSMAKMSEGGRETGLLPHASTKQRPGLPLSFFDPRKKERKELVAAVVP